MVDPPEKLKGDIRLTAVDITPEALGLDGKPIGNINPVVQTPAKSSAKSGKTLSQRPVRR